MQADALQGYRPFDEGYSFDPVPNASNSLRSDTEADRLALRLLSEGWASFDDIQKLVALVPGDTVTQACERRDVPPKSFLQVAIP